MDDINVSQIGDFEEGLLNHIRDNYVQILETITSTKSLDQETEATLKGAVEEFTASFD